MIGILLDLQISLGRIEILIMLSLAVYELGISLYIFRASLIFLSVFWFLVVDIALSNLLLSILCFWILFSRKQLLQISFSCCLLRMCIFCTGLVSCVLKHFIYYFQQVLLDFFFSFFFQAVMSSARRDCFTSSFLSFTSFSCHIAVPCSPTMGENHLVFNIIYYIS